MKPRILECKDKTTKACPYCNGAGEYRTGLFKQERNYCRRCKGTGRVFKYKQYLIIPGD